MKYPSKTADWLLCVASAVLLILAFPRTDLWVCAWVGLVPLMLVIDGKKPREAFRSAYLCGVMFFTGTLYWFFNVTQWFSYIAVVGVLLLLLYLALYFGAFGLIYSLFSRRKSLARLFMLPCAWVSLELIRATFFTGFDWASLGQSQYRNLPVIQIAHVTGMFGVSFLIVMVNVALKELITTCFIRKMPGAQKELSVIMWVTTATVAAVVGYGALCLSTLRDPKPTAPGLSVAIIQANIPQDIKWQESSNLLTVGKHIALTKQAAEHEPDLIIWPETSYPDYLWEENRLFTQVLALVRRIRIPILFGSVIKEDGNYYNAAILLSRDAQIVETYRKIHLVPFGEFIPLRRYLPFISGLLDIGDFTRGTEKTIFPSLAGGRKNGVFSVLVCFEDTVARLSRGFVRQGAQLLVNITNDAWFGNSKAPFMHLQSAVFRAVENRRGLVRAANTGVSCFIDRSGRIIGYVNDRNEGKNEKTYVSGYAIARMVFNEKETFYTKFGDVFAILCFGCILMGIAVGKKTVKRNNLQT